MHKIRNYLFFLFLVSSAILFSAGFTFAVEKPRQDEDILLDTYYRIEAKLERNSFGLPLFLESFERDNRVHVTVVTYQRQPILYLEESRALLREITSR